MGIFGIGKKKDKQQEESKDKKNAYSGSRKLESADDYLLVESDAGRPGTQKDEQALYNLNISDEDKRMIAKLIDNAITETEADEEWNAFLEKYEEAELRYLTESKDEEWPWPKASQRRTGGVAIAVDRTGDRTEQAIFESGHIVDVEPKATDEMSYEESRSVCEMQERTLDSIMRYEMRIGEIWPEVQHHALLNNVSWIKNEWNYSEREVTRQAIFQSPQELLMRFPDAAEKYPELLQRCAELMEMGEALTVEETTLKCENGLKPVFVDPRKMRLPAGICGDINNAWFIAEELEYTQDELMQLQEDGYFENVELVIGDRDPEEDPNDKFTVYQVILNIKLNERIPKHCVVWIAKTAESAASNDGDCDCEGTVFLRGRKYPYDHDRSFYILVRSREPIGGFYKGGYYDKLKSTAEAEDRRTNLIANAGDARVMFPIKHKDYPDSVLDPAVHKPALMAWIPVVEQDEVEPLLLPDVPQSAFADREDNRREASMLVGMDYNLMSGHVSERDPNAPAIKSQTLIGQSSIAARAAMKYMSRAITELAKQTQKCYYQYYDSDELTYKTDTGFESISLEYLRHPAYFSCKTAMESITAAEEAQSHLGLMREIAQYPATAQNFELQNAIARVVVRNWSTEMADVADKYMSEEAVQLQQAVAQLEQQFQQEVQQVVQEMQQMGATEEQVQMQVQQMQAAYQEQVQQLMAQQQGQGQEGMV